MVVELKIAGGDRGQALNSLGFIHQAHIYEFTMFYVLILISLLILWVLYRIILRKYGTREKELAHKVAERTTELEKEVVERKRAEDALAQERQLLDTLIENFPGNIFFKDTQSRFLMISRYLAKAYILNNPDEALGMTDFDYLPEDQARLNFEEEQIVMRTREAIMGRERKASLPDGREIWLSTTKLPLLNQEGELIGTFGISFDITERKLAQEALVEERNLLRTLIDNLPDLIYVKDVESRFVLSNLAHSRTMGASGPDDLIGKTDFDLLPKEYAEQYFEDDQAVIRSGEALVNIEEPLIDPYGKERWFITTKMPLHDSQGNVTGLVGTSHDMTDRRLSEDKLRLFAAKLERSNKELEEFASIASHDLQEPLRKIRAFGDRLQANAGGINPEAKDYLDRMQKAAARMQTLINDLLTFSRITTKAKPFVEVDIYQVIQEVLSDLEMQIERSGGSVEVGALPVIEADSVQMHQLFQNLISNALKFHKNNSPPIVKIYWRLKQEESKSITRGLGETKWCEIFVEDNGIGFDEKYTERIFQIFQRLHGRDEYEGTGIGLAVCRKIAERHGGKITAAGAPGQGSIFKVVLPSKQKKGEISE